jgi:hypothetical protein
MKKTTKIAALLATVAAAVAVAQVTQLIVRADPVTTFTDGSAFPAGTVVTYSLFSGECSGPRPLNQVAGNVSTPRVPRPVPTTPGTYCYSMTAVARLPTGVTVESERTPEIQRVVTAAPAPQLRPSAPANIRFE